MSRKISNDVAILRMREAGMQPLEPYPGRAKKWLCRCMSCGEVRGTYFDTICRGGKGCKPCANRQTGERRRLKQEVVDQLLLEAKLRAVEKYISTSKPLLCECLECGNYVSPTLADVKRGARCEYCSRTKVDPNIANNLARAAGLEPLEVFKSASMTWKCLHIKCGEVVYPHWSTLKKGGSGCMKCRGRNTSQVRKIPENEAISFMRSKGFEPLEPYVSAVTKWQSRCLKCNKIVEPRLNNVKNGSGCIYCTARGLNLSAPAFIYLMSHPELQAHKIGIGSLDARLNRISQHTKKGWVLFRTHNVESGLLALQLEQEILGFLFGECGLSPYLSAEQMPQGGHTETVDSSGIDLITLWSKVLEIIEPGLSQ